MAESLAACVSRLLNDQVMARKPVSRTRADLKCYKKVIDEASHAPSPSAPPSSPQRNPCSSKQQTG